VTTVRRPCACRSLIEAEPDPAEIALAVAYHQREPAHRDWRLRSAHEAETVPSYAEVRGELVTLRRVG